MMEGTIRLRPPEFSVCRGLPDFHFCLFLQQSSVTLYLWLLPVCLPVSSFRLLREDGNQNHPCQLGRMDKHLSLATQRFSVEETVANV